MKKITKAIFLTIKVFTASVLLVSSVSASGLLFEKITDPLEVTVKDCVELKNSPYMSAGTKSKCESFISDTQPLLDMRDEIQLASKKEKTVYFKSLRKQLKAQDILMYSFKADVPYARAENHNDLYLSIITMSKYKLISEDISHVKKHKKIFKRNKKYSLYSRKLVAYNEQKNVITVDNTPEHRTSAATSVAPVVSASASTVYQCEVKVVYKSGKMFRSVSGKPAYSKSEAEASAKKMCMRTFCKDRDWTQVSTDCTTR